MPMGLLLSQSLQKLIDAKGAADAVFLLLARGSYFFSTIVLLLKTRA